MIFVITGNVKCGKTTLVREIVEKLRGIKLRGFVTPSIFDGGRVVGYIAEVLPVNKRFLLVSTEGKGERIGRFVVLEEGKKRLISEVTSLEGDFFVFDEFGPLELRGGGLVKLFDEFLNSGNSGIVVVRSRILKDFLDLIKQPNRIFHAERISAEEVVNEIKNLFKGG